MFVIKLKRKRLIIFLAIILIIIAALFVLANVDFTSVDDYVQNGSDNYSLKAGSSDERLDFFKQLNLSADGESADEVIIPQSFNSVYEDYNEIQKGCGFDLSRYAGKSAVRYTYTLPDGDKAVILVLKNRVIGGHIASGVYGAEYLPLF